MMLAAAVLAVAIPASALARDIAIEPVTTSHILALAGDQEIAYRAVAETLPIVNAKGETTAQVAVIAYLEDTVPPDTRPVTFVFNGGPGAASAYLHLGALGPRVLVTGPEGTVPAPPARLEDNPHTWLAFTDLVFIDPVGTGFSRVTAADDEASEAFWSVSGDIESMAEIIRLWLTRYDRWPSPKFIAGESYGGFRAARLARALLDEQGVAMNGLVLISPALNFALIDAQDSTVLPWAVTLPSMVASARAHDKGDPAMPLDAVERFALTDYLAGIAAIAPAGPGPDPALVARLAGLLGLEEELVRRYHGRIPAWVFAEKLLEGTGQALSLYDGAQTGPDPRPGRPGDPDPQLAATKAPFATAYVSHVRETLGLETELTFRLLNPRVNRDWDWEGGRATIGAMDELAETLALTPELGVLVVHGRTDMVTPYMASAWLLDRLDLPDDIRENVRLEVLDGGHMMYLETEMRAALTELAAAFYREMAPAS